MDEKAHENMLREEEKGKNVGINIIDCHKQNNV